MARLTPEVLDKVLVSMLEKPFLGTMPRVLRAVLAVLLSLALVLNGARRRGRKWAHKFVINRQNSIATEQVLRRMDYRTRTGLGWI